MIGNAREQLFHPRRSFHFDENVEKIDACMQSIRQVAAKLNYEEPKILEVFKTLCLPVCIWYYSQLRP